MTRQVKQYIELSDIIGIRLECNHCKTTLSFPLSERFDFQKIIDCPSCGRTWVSEPMGPTVVPEIESAIASLKALSRALGAESKFNTQLRLTLELTPEPLASDHAVSDKG